MGYKTKKELEKINFTNRSKDELSKINSVSGNKSEGAKKRWFRHNNPDIDALMTFYKNGDQNTVMTKYVGDNERFMGLFKTATNVKADITEICDKNLPYLQKTASHWNDIKCFPERYQ